MDMACESSIDRHRSLRSLSQSTLIASPSPSSIGSIDPAISLVLLQVLVLDDVAPAVIASPPPLTEELAPLDLLPPLPLSGPY